jgi:cell division protein FtsW (lipid II flippase)
MWCLGACAALFSLGLLVLFIATRRAQEPWAVVGLVGSFGLMAVYCLGDAAYVRGTYDRQGIEFSTPWTGKKRGQWSELRSTKENPWGGWFALTFADGTTIRLSRMLRGHQSALDVAKEFSVH